MVGVNVKMILTEQIPLFWSKSPAQRANSVSTTSPQSVVSKIGRSTVLATVLGP